MYNLSKNELRCYIFRALFRCNIEKLRCVYQFVLHIV